MLLLEADTIAADPWSGIADDAPLPAGPALVSLARLPGLAAHPAGLGVEVAGATQAADLAPLLDRVSLVAIRFAIFRDGRGFTLARLLRERHGFAGEIRAIGHVLPDQHAFLRSCGFSTVALAEGTDIAPWVAALSHFQAAYQPSLTTGARLGGMRRLPT